ncbi:hypothetical protein ACJMK2_010204 [Sinanodonta woodiana]|uniref:Uncharacterized protein n=1 Tax=Sinanodonta woodiana TaxID=1069815 RepID=A0ABD3VEL0_SINWO
MLPGLRCLRQDMATIAQDHEDVLASMIKDYESKLETKRNRSNSTIASLDINIPPGAPGMGEDIKARMMNRLKESTVKTNIGNLFTRKK